MTVPPEAITAAARAYRTGRDGRPAEGWLTHVLEAAAPSLRAEGAAAERDRIRQLAEEHRAHFDCDPAWGTPFADLLRGDQP